MIVEAKGWDQDYQSIYRENPDSIILGQTCCSEVSRRPFTIVLSNLKDKNVHQYVSFTHFRQCYEKNNRTKNIVAGQVTPNCNPSLNNLFINAFMIVIL